MIPRTLLASAVLALCASTALATDLIQVWEAAQKHDPQGAIATMNRLHDRGILMSVDDFGTGYSSLSYLKRFRVYKLKIDMSFVRDMDTHAGNRAIVTAVIGMAKALKLETVAEGVETAAQAALLAELHCDEAQGYLYSKALPPQVLLQRWLQQPSTETAPGSTPKA